MTSSQVDQYKQVNTHGNVEDASAHKLIEMLLAGALEKINLAKIAIKKNDIAKRGENISFAITILDGLQASLDMEKGGEISENLLKLYTYMMERLVLANLDCDEKILDEVAGLLITIKTGWDGIKEEAEKFERENPRTPESN